MRQPIVSAGVAPAIGPFAAAVRDRDAVYTSGQVAQDPVTGKLVEGGVAVQTAQVFANLRAVLRDGGKTLDDVFKVNVFLTDMADFPAMNEVYATQFEPPYPARTTIAVRALPLGAAVEMEVIAR